MTPSNLRKKELVLVPGCRGLESITSGKARHEDRSHFHTGSEWGRVNKLEKRGQELTNPTPETYFLQQSSVSWRFHPHPQKSNPLGPSLWGKHFSLKPPCVSQSSEKGDCWQPPAPSFSLSLPSALVDHFCPEFCAYHSSRASLYNSGSPLKSVPWFMLSATLCECTEK